MSAAPRERTWSERSWSCLDLDQRGEIPALDRVVIETTGLADPAPILHTIYADPVLQHHFAVDLVLTTVDAVNGELHLDRNPESVKQVAAADKSRRDQDGHSGAGCRTGPAVQA